MKRKKNVSAGMRVFYVLSWLYWICMFVVMVLFMTEVIVLPDTDLSVFQSIGAITGLMVLMILSLGAFTGVALSLESPKKCRVCRGSGLIPAGAWTDISEAETCSYCAGSGEDPEKEPYPQEDSEKVSVYYHGGPW